MLSKLIKKKERAFALGTEYFNRMLASFNAYSLSGVHQQMKDKYIGLNVLDVTKFIYTNSDFYEYLKYSFLGKYYQKKISLIEWIVIFLFIFVGFVFYLIFDFGLIFIILSILLIVGLLLLFAFVFKTGEKYSSYYNRTMFSFLMNVYNNVKFNLYGNNLLTDEELNVIINKTYDKKKATNSITFSGNVCSGNILDLELIDVKERQNKDGSTRKTNDKIFDGFYLKINTNNRFNMFRGNTIKIRADENMLSSLTEDTVRGIYESEREISFNAEEMNKSFDGRISGYNGFDDVDDMMIQVQKVLTPSFEEHLLYLRERYNTFNMNIGDDGLVFAVNMDRSFFQKVKHNELMDFTKTYREANERFRMVRADVNGIEDFTYYNVFPFLERLYLINYLTYLYLSYMDFDNYYNINSGNIKSFEESMRVVYTMDNKEFRQLYTDKIKEIKDNTKEFVKKFCREEKI